MAYPSLGNLRPLQSFDAVSHNRYAAERKNLNPSYRRKRRNLVIIQRDRLCKQITFDHKLIGTRKMNASDSMPFVSTRLVCW
jgi:hypothetical protein